jgi:hypothetical protein
MSGFGSFYYRDYEEPETGQKIERMEIVRVTDPIDAALDYFGADLPAELFDEDRNIFEKMT